MRNKSSIRHKTQNTFLKKGFIAVAVIVLAVLSLKLISVFKNSLWDGAERINFVINAQDVTLVSFEPVEKTLTFVEIPSNTLMEVTRGYGEYQLGAIEKLGELEKRKDLTRETLQENLALPVTGIIQNLTSQENKVNSRDNLNDILIKGLTGKNKTNLSGWDMVRLWWQIKSVKEADVLIFNLEKRDLLTVKILADRTKVYTLDTPIFDLKMQNLMGIQVVKDENLTLEIFNATKTIGLAEKASRIFTNIGVRVVFLNNAEKEADKTIIKGNKNLKKTKTVGIIKRLFNCEWQDTSESERADLTLIIGNDYNQKLQEK